MAERYQKLGKEEQACLRVAIELAVKKKFGPNSKPYKDLYQEERDQVARACGLSPQTFTNFLKGADKLSCNLSSLNLISEYIGEVNWDGFLEKHRQIPQTTVEEIEPNPLLNQAVRETPGVVVSSGKVDETVTAKRQQPENAKVSAFGERRARSERNIIKTIVILCGAAIGLFFVSRTVNETTVDVYLKVSAVTFVLEKPAEVSSIQARNYIRIDSATLYGAPFLDGIKSKLTANGQNAEQPVRLEQLNIPSDFRVTFESPIKDQLFIKLISTNAATVSSVDGKISNYQNLIINKRDIIPIDSIKSLTKAITFKSSLKKDESFELAIVSAGEVDIPWMIVKEIKFLTKENFYDVKSGSSILEGHIFFTETADSVSLAKFDDLHVTLTKPVRMRLIPKASGLHVNFSGDVRQLSRGSELLGTPQKNLMPQFYTVLIAAIPTLAWTAIGTVLTLLLILLKAGKRLKKLMILTLILSGFSASAQLDNVERFRSNATRIQVGNEKGSGFICAQSGDSVFVISAHHVVAHRTNPIHVTMHDNRTFVGKIAFTDAPHDLVVIGIEAKDYQWDPVPIATNVELGDRVFFITLSEATKPLLPLGTIATIDKWDFDNGIQYVTTNAVIGGDSGSALLCENGVAGMIFTDQVRSLDILTIRNLILKWNKEKWQLPEFP